MAVVTPQTGTSTILAGTTSITITAGAQYTAPSSNSLIRIVSNNYCGDGATGNFSGIPDGHTVIITNPGNIGTSITFARATSTTEDIIIHWEILDFANSEGTNWEIQVRDHSGLALTNAESTKDTGVISGVVTAADVVPMITSASCDDAASARAESEEYIFITEWVSASSVSRVTKNSTPILRSSQVTVATIEFVGSNWSVQRIPHTYALADTDESETLSTTLGATTQAFIIPMMYIEANNPGPSYGGQRVWISSTTQITFRIEDISLSASGLAYVVEDTSGSTVVQHISGSRAADVGTNPDTWTETISAVTVADSSIMGLSATTNLGSDCHYSSMGAVITGTTTVTLSRGNINERRDYWLSVVEWATAAVTPPPTPNENQIEPVFGGGKGWPSRRDLQKKKDLKVQQQNEEVMKIIEQSFTILLDYYKD